MKFVKPLPSFLHRAQLKILLQKRMYFGVQVLTHARNSILTKPLIFFLNVPMVSSWSLIWASSFSFVFVKFFTLFTNITIYIRQRYALVEMLELRVFAKLWSKTWNFTYLAIRSDLSLSYLFWSSINSCTFSRSCSSAFK